MSQITGIVLSGGKSSRMKLEKGLMPLGSKAMIEWPISILRKFCSRILISTNSSDYDVFQFDLIADIYTDCGPMGGLHAALKASQTEHNLLISCDMPFVNEAIIEQIIEKSYNYQAVIASSEGKFIPVCGFYNRSILPQLELELEAGKLKMQQFVRNLDSFVQPFDDAESKLRLMNINTPEEFEQASKMIDLLQVRKNEK